MRKAGWMPQFYYAQGIPPRDSINFGFFHPDSVTLPIMVPATGDLTTAILQAAYKAVVEMEARG